MAPPKQVTRVGAYGLIIQEQKILLCRISSQLPRLAGQWTLPGGGVEFREDPEAAMVREVKEETGLVVESGGLAAVDSNAVDTDETLFHGIRIIYQTQVVGGTLRNEEDGTTDLCQWWPLDGLNNIDLVDLAERGVELCT